MTNATHAQRITKVAFQTLTLVALLGIGACTSSGSDRGPGAGATGGTAGTTNVIAGELPIVAAPGADVPYQFGDNAYGVAGGAFLAKAPMGSSTVVLDTTQPGKICLKGTVEMVPTPPDGSHPPYSTWWGLELGFNLNQDATGTKSPWTVPSSVSGFWFTLEGATIPEIRFKTTPTGRDPALEQDSCAVVRPATGEPSQVPFTRMYVQCWNGPVGTGPTNISAGLLDMGLQVAAATGVEYPIDFCLTHIGVALN